MYPYEQEILAALDNGQNVSLLADVKKAIEKAMLLSTPTPPSAEQPQFTLRICEETDRECGDRPQGWCATCPKRVDDTHNSSGIKNMTLDDVASRASAFAKRFKAGMVEQPDSAAPKVTDAEINDITLDALGKWAFIRSAELGVQISHKPQRITEQDARELLSSFYDWSNLPKGEADFDIYFNKHGKALLAKLNEHREPNYK